MPAVNQLSDVLRAVIEERTSQYQEIAGRDWADRAQAANPAKKHGAIHYESDGLHVPLIPYLLSVGSRPHIIRALHARFLHFFWSAKGRWFMGLTVHHPGYKGTGYLQTTWQETQDELSSGRI